MLQNTICYNWGIGHTLGYICLSTFSQTIDFRLFQTERNAYDNFRYDKNGRKFFKQVENTVGKGEIARYEQFLFFPQCFQKTRTSDT